MALKPLYYFALGSIFLKFETANQLVNEKLHTTYTSMYLPFFM